MNERDFAALQLQIQNELLAKIATGSPLSEILITLVQALEQGLSQGVCAILLLGQNNRLYPGAAPSLPNSYHQANHGVLCKDDMRPCAKAVLRHETVIVPNIKKASFTPEYKELLLGHGLRACWSIPIYGGDSRVLGVFSTYYQAARSPQKYELATTAQMAYLAGIAIERQQAEEQLRYSEAMLLEAQQVAHVGNWALDVFSQTMNWSPEMFRIHGLEPGISAPSYGEFLQMLPTKDRQRLSQCVEQAIVVGLPHTTEYSIVRPDGSLSYQELRVAVKYDLQGHAQRLFGTVLDITERKQSDLALQNLVAGTVATGKDFFPALVRHIAEALNVSYAIVTERVDDQLQTLAFWANGVLMPAYTYALARTPCDYVFQMGEFYCNYDVQKRFPDDLDLAKLGAESYLGIALMSNQGQAIGHLYILHNQPIANPSWAKQILRVFGARAAAELERLQSGAASKRQLAAIEAAIDGISIIQDGTYLYVNQAYVDLFCYERPDELIGQSWKLRYSVDEVTRLEEEVLPQLEHNRAWQGEAIATRKDGSTFAQGVSLTLTEDGLLISVCRDISNLKQAQALITHNALHDPLTNLPNRALLLERLELAMNRAKHLARYHYAVLFIDLDRFKVINDSLGHIVGDQLLIAIAQRLQNRLRKTDLVARLGGDEFVVLLEDFSNVEDVVQVVRQIQKDCQTSVVVNEHQIFTGMSIGIVLGNQDYQHADELIRDADIAMYRAKQQESNSYKFFDTVMHTQALQRLTLEADLRQAFEKDEFTVYYQPIVNLSNYQLVGFEVLARWNHPVRGIISPDEFIPIVEEIGLIVALDRWVFEQACAQIKRWRAKSSDFSSLKVSVNLSAQGLRKTSLLQDIDDSLKKHHLSGIEITLEITESMLIEDIDQTIGLLSQLTDRQIQISIDDFGTGYSSLNYLHRLPVNNLKIDQSFVSQMHLETRNHRVVETIVTLSSQLDLTVVAEGIETYQQLQYIQKLGCQFGQGYLFSKPLPAEAIETQLLRGNQLPVWQFATKV
ncbi:MAG: EAL domain-containing protein [Cyanobacteria bacterium P01_D01_bin.156]